MSLSAFARGIGSVSVSQTALAVLAMDCSMYISFLYLYGELKDFSVNVVFAMPKSNGKVD